MTLNRLRAAVAVVTALHAVGAWAANDQAPGFYERKEEGWFWYEVEPEPVEEPEPEPLPPPSAEAPPAPEPAPAQPPAPAPFSTAWVRENLPKYLDAAVDNPTLENVRAYLYLQRFAIDRSHQFSDVASLAVVGDPFLDEVSRRPSATFANQTLDREAAAQSKKLITAIGQQVGLFFFFRADCPACEVQAPILKMLEDSYGYTILPISVDGKALPGGFFPEYRVDAGHAETLGVETYPAMFLATPGGEFAAVGQGIVSLPDLGQRILAAARRSEWITDEQLDRTRPVLNNDNRIAERLAAASGEHSIEQLAAEAQDDDGFIPPEKLMDYIRTRLEK